MGISFTISRDFFQMKLRDLVMQFLSDEQQMSEVPLYPSGKNAATENLFLYFRYSSMVPFRERLKALILKMYLYIYGDYSSLSWSFK